MPKHDESSKKTQDVLKQNEIPYQNWISHSDKNYENYASDGPGPLEIEAGESRNPSKNGDKELESEILKLVYAENNINTRNVLIKVQNQIVSLSGLVDKYDDAHELEKMIRTVSGVKKILNSIEVIQ